MLTPEQIRQQALNRFPDVVHASLNGQVSFPWEVRFGRADTSETLGNLRRQIEALLEGSREKVGFGYQVALVSRRLRLHDEQLMPDRVWFETQVDYLRFINQEMQLRSIEREFAALAENAPEAAQWLRERSRTYFRRVTEAGGRALGLAVHALHSNPQPKCFAREIPLPDVSGKFIEDRVRLIAEILQGIKSPAWREADNPHAQLGLRTAPRMLRTMVLDGGRLDYGVNETRFAVPAAISRLLVVENLRSFMTLPDIPGTLAVFGEGRAAEALHRIAPSVTVPLYYWGDMDPHGYSILNALRADYPAAKSVLMDYPAFKRYSSLLAKCSVPVNSEFERLTEDEKLAAGETCRIQKGIEQEKIPPADVRTALTDAFVAG
jgi:hypothetical protein